MQILLAGLNHKTAPVEVRERIAFDSDSAAQALIHLKEKYPAGEFVILSTCNRVELYSALNRSSDPSPIELVKTLAEFRGIDFEAIDGAKSNIFVLTLSPKSSTSPHMQFMSMVSQVLNEEGRKSLLATCA